MKLITISREFGSGGRELGKRLADELGFAYYDREIIAEIASRMALDENYVDATLERGIEAYPVHFGRSFAGMTVDYRYTIDVFVMQEKILKEIAVKTNAVIVGRSADIILEDFKPLNIFVYADIESKIERCRKRASANEGLSDKKMARKIKAIDKKRAKSRGFFTSKKWGERSAYHLMLNTTGVEIKALIKPLSEYALSWFDKNEQ